ncbi:hypothetical protein PgNI_11354 [Pyricularia grisea]|uniref:Uncharacterized protein n=1 Tax=Pyricularia grisea TaxID=148305 RepID=A0A6P8AQ25_PYRGI|nr:hypothetical protein PgNI_11354 [Pyricularia grisea]TLD04130.1 hypothetical protein PgNI_11354 [Pyricularia grisea]
MPWASIETQKIFVYLTTTQIFSEYKPILQDVGDDIILLFSGSGPFDTKFVSRSTAPKIGKQ